MAEAIPKRDWLEVEEDLCRMAYLEFLVEHWLWDRPLSVPQSTEDLPRVDLEVPLGERNFANRAMAIQALQDFGWFQEPRSSASH
jgi:hypothetical protein